jgi:hypothetical protein
MNKKFIYILLSALLFSNTIYAADNTGDTAVSADTNNGVDVEKKFELKLSGEHSFKFKAPATDDYSTDGSSFKGNLAPKFKNTFGVEFVSQYVKLVSNWEVDLSITNTDKITDVIYAAPLENYIAINAWKFKFGLGLQYFTWGSADKLNPTDNINPRNLTTEFTSNYTGDAKLPVLSGSVDFYPIDQLSFQVVYVPFYQRTTLPDMKLDDKISDYKSTDYSGINYNDKEFNFKDFTIGGKINAFLSAIDFSFSYLYDVDPYYTPEITLGNKQTAVSAGDIFTPAQLTALGGIPAATSMADVYYIKSLDLVHKRLHRFGTDFKVTVDRVGFWGEACYTMTEDYLMNDYAIRNHQLNWTTGFDVTYGPNSDFRINFQYQGQFVPDYDMDFYKDYNNLDSTKLVSYTTAYNNIMTTLGKSTGSSHDADYYKELYYRYAVYKLANINEGLVQMFSINMTWPVLDSMLTPEISAIYALPLLYDTDYETRYGGLFVEPKFDIKPVDDLHIIIGADLAYTWIKKHGEDKISFDDEWQFGRFRKENCIFLEVKYKWSFSFFK